MRAFSALLAILLGAVLLVQPGAGDPWPSVANTAGAPGPEPSAPIADNRRCFVCHANYEDEPLSTIHATNNIGGVRCHGQSSPHSTDD